MSKIIIDATQVLQNPCIRLNGREITLLSKYVDIVIDILDSGSRHYIAESISSVVASVFYQFAGFIHNTMSNQCSAGKSPSTRQRKLFEQFMRLAAENHRYERQMAFYADKLCITPKYLSKIVRDQSGKSGPQWIDDLVILSAENMLKNSDIPIKEISSYLNFPSQSLFFRFFKKQTGRTPSQYRQS